ncbi:MAG: hypothetical protein ACJA00_002221 [Myxococcota bacterium]|jgi:hypothetical protein
MDAAEPGGSSLTKRPVAPSSDVNTTSLGVVLSLA